EPNNAEAHCGLGQALRDRGRLADALVSLRRGHTLGARVPGWSKPSGVWVRECEHLLELERKLPAILDGKAKPATAAERAALSYLGTVKQLYAWAAHFSAEAFAAGAAGELGPLFRSRAACCAALAGCGQGKDAARLDEKVRARWRSQA